MSSSTSQIGNAVACHFLTFSEEQLKLKLDEAESAYISLEIPIFNKTSNITADKGNKTCYLQLKEYLQDQFQGVSFSKKIVVKMDLFVKIKTVFHRMVVDFTIENNKRRF